MNPSHINITCHNATTTIIIFTLQKARGFSLEINIRLMGIQMQCGRGTGDRQRSPLDESKVEDGRF